MGSGSKEGKKPKKEKLPVFCSKKKKKFGVSGSSWGNKITLGNPGEALGRGGKAPKKRGKNKPARKGGRGCRSPLKLSRWREKEQATPPKGGKRKFFNRNTTTLLGRGGKLGFFPWRNRDRCTVPFGFVWTFGEASHGTLSVVREIQVGVYVKVTLGGWKVKTGKGGIRFQASSGNNCQRKGNKVVGNPKLGEKNRNPSKLIPGEREGGRKGAVLKRHPVSNS